MIPDFDNERWVCICDALRACEELREGWCVSTCGNTHYTIGYEEGLDAAREAVAATVNDPNDPKFVRTEYQCCGTSAPEYMRDDAIAAIDALREEQAPPPLPPSVGVPSKPMWPLREEQK